MGRPRAADRTPPSSQAAKDLLGEVGYDRLRIQDVADRAGAGLATLYRRWPTKQALIADAIGHHADALLAPSKTIPWPTSWPSTGRRSTTCAARTASCCPG